MLVLIDRENKESPAYLTEVLKWCLEKDRQLCESDPTALACVASKLAAQLVYLAEYGTSLGEGKTDPTRCRVKLWPHRYNDAPGFDIVWEFKNKHGGYDYFMNGGLVFFESDNSWSVHT